MGKHNIEKFSFVYSFLKIIMRALNNIYYRKVIVIGRENLDSSNHYIFAPTHQNSVMDALAVIATCGHNPIFLARSDAFKKGFIEKMLYSFKILPVYRIRDGFDNLTQNDEIFKKTIDVIQNKSGLAILPEGEHSKFRRLKPLKKGICRIAFQAEESQNFNLGIKIVPIGLEYTHYKKFREVLTVVYGKPFGIEEFFDLYKESPQKAYNKLRDKISDNMKPLMVHIESENDYDSLNELREIVNGKYSDSRKDPKIFRDIKLISSMERIAGSNPEQYKNICEKSNQIKELSSELNVSYRNLTGKNPGIFGIIAGLIGLVISLPLFVYGFLLNSIFYFIPLIPLKKIRDIMFHSSVRFVILLILAIVIIPVYALLAFLLAPNWWISLLIFISILPSGLFAWNYWVTLERLKESIRIRRYIKTDNKKFLQFKEIHKNLSDNLKKFVVK